MNDRPPAPAPALQPGLSRIIPAPAPARAASTSSRSGAVRSPSAPSGAGCRRRALALALRNRRTQKCRIPEAPYVQVGQELLIGKGDRASLFFVVGRESANVLLLKFKRQCRPALFALALCAIVAALPALAQLAAPLPRAWAGGGAAYAASVPPVSGWASYANLISQSGQIYSFTTHEISSNRETRPYTIQTSVRSGVAAVVRRFGPLTILGLGDVGLAGSGTSVAAAWSGGGVAILQLGKTDWTLLFMPIQSKGAVGGSQTGWRFGLGRKFD